MLVRDLKPVRPFNAHEVFITRVYGQFSRLWSLLGPYYTAAPLIQGTQLDPGVT